MHIAGLRRFITPLKGTGPEAGVRKPHPKVKTIGSPVCRDLVGWRYIPLLTNSLASLTTPLFQLFHLPKYVKCTSLRWLFGGLDWFGFPCRDGTPLHQTTNPNHPLELEADPICTNSGLVPLHQTAESAPNHPLGS